MIATGGSEHPATDRRTFEFSVSDLSSRNDSLSTYFLAAFAMLYVVGESLPKTDLLTRIDKVIVLTTSCLVITGITSVVLHRQSERDLDRAEEWNTLSKNLGTSGSRSEGWSAPTPHSP